MVGSERHLEGSKGPKVEDAADSPRGRNKVASWLTEELCKGGEGPVASVSARSPIGSALDALHHLSLAVIDEPALPRTSAMPLDALHHLSLAFDPHERKFQLTWDKLRGLGAGAHERAREAAHAGREVELFTSAVRQQQHVDEHWVEAFYRAIEAKLEQAIEAKLEQAIGQRLACLEGTLLHLAGSNVVELGTEASVADVLKRIDVLQIESARENWDDEGGVPITAAQWQRARDLVRWVSEIVASAPQALVSACGDGTAHLLWSNAAGDRGLLELGRDSMWWTFMSASAEADSVEQVSNIEDVFTRVRKLVG